MFPCRISMHWLAVTSRFKWWKLCGSGVLCTRFLRLGSCTAFRQRSHSKRCTVRHRYCSSSRGNRFTYGTTVSLISPMLEQRVEDALEDAPLAGGCSRKTANQSLVTTAKLKSSASCPSKSPCRNMNSFAYATESMASCSRDSRPRGRR